MFHSLGFLIFITITSSSYSFTLIESGPPQPWQTALMGRYVIHNSDWVSISTISTLSSIKTYPFVNLKSMSDGPVSKGTGIPYLYMTELDLSGKDIEQDSRCTVLASLAQSEYCKSEKFDPQDPRCARVILTGHILKVDNTTAEFAFAQNALYSRHPAMKGWPTDHDFYIAKVDIEQVAVLDFFGGVKFVSIEDYFNANDNLYDDESLFEHVKIIDITL